MMNPTSLPMAMPAPMAMPQQAPAPQPAMQAAPMPQPQDQVMFGGFRRKNKEENSKANKWLAGGALVALAALPGPNILAVPGLVALGVGAKKKANANGIYSLKK